MKKVFWFITPFNSKKVWNQPKKTEISQKWLKNVWKGNKSTKKRQIWGTPSESRPAVRSRQKHVFFVHFQTFFSNFSREITEKALKWTKKVEKRLIKGFYQLLGARSTQKLVKIHNIGQFSQICTLWISNAIVKH